MAQRLLGVSFPVLQSREDRIHGQALLNALVMNTLTERVMHVSWNIFLTGCPHGDDIDCLPLVQSLWSPSVQTYCLPQHAGYIIIIFCCAMVWKVRKTLLRLLKDCGCLVTPQLPSFFLELSPPHCLSEWASAQSSSAWKHTLLQPWDFRLWLRLGHIIHPHSF